MTKLAPEWVRTSDPVIRSPARYRWTTAPVVRLQARRQLDNAGKPEYVLSDYSEIKPTEVDFSRIDTEWTKINLGLIETYRVDVAYAVEGQVVSLK